MNVGNISFFSHMIHAIGLERIVVEADSIITIWFPEKNPTWDPGLKSLFLFVLLRWDQF